MTPKEKAKELFNNILEKMPHPDVTNANVYSISKQCALIAVDEILNYQNQLLKNYKVELKNTFWEQVKQEIETL